MNPVLGTLHKAPRELRTHFRRIYWTYSCIAIAVKAGGTRSRGGLGVKIIYVAGTYLLYRTCTIISCTCIVVTPFLKTFYLFLRSFFSGNSVPIHGKYWRVVCIKEGLWLRAYSMVFSQLQIIQFLKTFFYNFASLSFSGFPLVLYYGVGPNALRHQAWFSLFDTFSFRLKQPKKPKIGQTFHEDEAILSLLC